MANENGMYKIAILSDGREIRIEVEAMGRDLPTHRDVKRLNSMRPLTDEYDEWLSKYCGLSVKELDALPRDDYRKVERAISAALAELTSPN